jgi:C-terminal processing protease CtpA/Prc
MSKAETEKENSNQSDLRQAEGKMIGSHIGYILVTNLSALNDTTTRAFASNIQALIRKLDTENEIQGWIVDLRDNPGGNMWPMVTGLGPLLGNGVVGNFVFRGGKQKQSWVYKDGATTCGKEKCTSLLTFYTLKNRPVKIAVLIGRHTGSSGEMTAMAFLGKPNSAGYTTANGLYPLPDKSCLVLAHSFAADRNCKIYDPYIVPDVSIVKDEEVISAAEKWLQEP